MAEPEDDLARLKALAQQGDAALWWQADALVERLGSDAVDVLDDLLAMDVAGDREFADARFSTLIAVADALVPVLTPARVLPAVRLAVALLVAVDARGGHFRLPSTIGGKRFFQPQVRVLALFRGSQRFAFVMPASERAEVVHALEEAGQTVGTAWSRISAELHDEFVGTLRAFQQESGDPAPWIERLRSDDYGERKDAAERLGTFGEAAVPALARELAYRHPHSQFRAVEALATIGGRAVAWALVAALPKASLALRLELARALVRTLPALVDSPCRDDFDLFLALVRSAKHAPEAADRAAGAIASLAKSEPFPQLRLALKPLRGGFLNPPSPAFAEACAAVEAATSAWADLPLPASAPPPDPTDLPRPSEEGG